MFFLEYKWKWIGDVVKLLNENQLNPEKSRFMIAFLSSMDYEIVDYYNSHQKQISSYSGSNFHIFTPIIFEGNLVDDDQVRTLREEFRNFGIPISSKPVFVFFKFQKKQDETYEPVFFGGFVLSSFDNFHEKLKETIYHSTQVDDVRQLQQTLLKNFRVKNLIDKPQMYEDLSSIISDKLPKSKIFISHSSVDKPFVKRLIATLSTTDLNFWIDEREIKAGDDIQQSISKNLKESNYLLAVVSKNSVSSNWVGFELSQFIGFTDNKNIIPIIIDKEQQFPEPIDNVIRRLKYIDFSNENLWSKNVEELKDALSRRRIN